MRTPAFWFEEGSALAALLAPLGMAYGAITARRMGRTGVRGRARTICVGNLTAGGAGKTPVAIAIAEALRTTTRVAFLSRGYGGSEAGPVLVDPALHPADLVGDEPLLLARHAATIVSRDKPLGARLADHIGIETLILDDGLQNPSLQKDLRIAVVDGATGIGNGHCLPAGPLRAPLALQWPHLDALVIMGGGSAGNALADLAEGRGLPVHRARLEPAAAAIAALGGHRVLAFAGIGRPAKFFASLDEHGVTIDAKMEFPDHHRFRESDARAILDRAERDGLVPVTTEKDYVRLAAANPGTKLGALAEIVRIVPAAVRFDDEVALNRLVSGPTAAFAG